MDSILSHIFVSHISTVYVENNLKYHRYRVSFPSGEFEDTGLPAKKSFGTKNKEFLENKREGFEQYLQVCLS